MSFQRTCASLSNIPTVGNYSLGTYVYCIYNDTYLPGILLLWLSYMKSCFTQNMQENKYTQYFLWLSYDFHSECSETAKLFKLRQVFVPLLQYINRTQNSGHIHRVNFEWKTNVRRISHMVSENFHSFLSSGGNKLKLGRMILCMVWEAVIGGGGGQCSCQ